MVRQRQVVERIPRTTTRAELNQAQDLILRGKTFAAAGDPRLSRVVNALLSQGFSSVEKIVAAREAQLQQAKEAKEAPPRTVPAGFIGPLRPGVTREVRTVPAGFIGPLRPGTVREPRVVPAGFIGPLRPGVEVRDTAAIPEPTVSRLTLTRPGEDIGPTFEKRQIGEVRGIPTTAFFNVITGRQATLKQETTLREREVAQREIGRQPTTIEREVIQPVTRIFSAADAKIQKLLDRIDRAGKKLDFPLVRKLEEQLNKLEAKRLQISIIPKERDVIRGDIDKVLSTFTTPQGVRTLAGIPAGLTLKGGEILAETLEPGIKRIPIIGEPLMEEAPFTREQVRDVLTDVFLLAAFSPFIKTATAKQTQVKAKPVKISDKERLKKIIKLREEVARSSEAKVKRFVKRKIEIIRRDAKTPGEQARQLRNLELFVREARGQIVIQDGKIIPIVDLNKIAAVKTNPNILKPRKTIEVDLPEGVKLERLPEILSGAATRNRLRVQEAKDRDKERIRSSSLSPAERIAERGAFGAPSIFAGTGQFEKTEGVGVRLSDQLGQVDQQLRSKTISKGQEGFLQIRQKNLQNQIRINNISQLQKSNQILDSLTRQQQQSLQKQQSLQRQISFSSNASKVAQLTKQLTAQKSLTKQMSGQVQRAKLTSRSISRRIARKPIKLVKKPKRLIPFPKRKPIRPVTKEPTKLKFQTFVRRRGIDSPRKKFNTLPSARKGLKKTLSRSIAASGFIKNLNTGQKVIPKVSKGFRVSKVDPFRIVEKRNLRLDSRKEVAKIQQAKRAKKPFKGKSNFKKTKSIGRNNGKKEKLQITKAKKK